MSVIPSGSILSWFRSNEGRNLASNDEHKYFKDCLSLLKISEYMKPLSRQSKDPKRPPSRRGPLWAHWLGLDPAFGFGNSCHESKNQSPSSSFQRIHGSQKVPSNDPPKPLSKAIEKPLKLFYNALGHTKEAVKMINSGFVSKLKCKVVIEK